MIVIWCIDGDRRTGRLLDGTFAHLVWWPSQASRWDPW